MTQAVLTDRTYWHVPGARAWHARVRPDERDIRAACGRWTISVYAIYSDRVPSDAHLCGNCARVIAAETDVEP